MRGLGVILLGAALAGCDAPTTALIDLSLRAGDPLPSAVKVGLYGPRGAILTGHDLAITSVPGTVVLRGLPSVATPLRVGFVGETGTPTVYGAGTFTSVPHGQVRLAVELSSLIGDSDGDGVPDPIDVCPTVPDPGQEADADGRGLACGGVLPLDGGSGDGPSPPMDLAGTDHGTVTTACPGPWRFCDGFETGAFSPLNYSIQRAPPYGLTFIDTVEPYWGSYAVRTTLDVSNADGGSPYVGQLLVGRGGLPAGATFIRFYYKTDIPLGVGGILFSLNGLQMPYPAIRWTVANDKLHLDSVNVTGATSRQSAQGVPTRRWVCVELQVDPAVGVRLWLDGAEVTDIALPPFTLTNSSGQLGAFYTGFDGNIAAGTPPFSMQLDELVLDSQRIGCLP